MIISDDLTEKQGHERLSSSFSLYTYKHMSVSLGPTFVCICRSIYLFSFSFFRKLQSSDMCVSDSLSLSFLCLDFTCTRVCMILCSCSIINTSHEHTDDDEQRSFDFDAGLMGVCFCWTTRTEGTRDMLPSESFVQRPHASSPALTSSAMSELG